MPNKTKVKIWEYALHMFKNSRIKNTKKNLEQALEKWNWVLESGYRTFINQLSYYHTFKTPLFLSVKKFTSPCLKCRQIVLRRNHLQALSLSNSKNKRFYFGMLLLAYYAS